MTIKSDKLNNQICQDALPKEKAYKLSDGKSMYLQVMPNGAKYWRMKYRKDGKEARFSFGVYPVVSLEEAREKRSDARRALRGYKLSKKLKPLIIV